MTGACALVLAGCATTNVAPLDSPDVALARDEQKLWESAEALTRAIDRSGGLFVDPELQLYLQSVSDRLLAARGPLTVASPRVYVLSSPDTNAFMLANGHLYITTGLLGRTTSGDQVATILGHELVHYLNRHSLKGARQAANQKLLRDLLAGLAAGIGAAAGGQAMGEALGNYASSASEQWQLAAVSGYSRELETEADEVGFEMLRESGFDVTEAPQVFMHLMAELADEGLKEPYFYATHPRLEERLARYQALVAGTTAPAPVVAGSDPWKAHRQRVLLHDIGLNVEAERFASARRELEAYEALGGRDGRSAFFLGEVERLTAATGLSAAALAYYEEAAGHADVPPMVFRELGLAGRAADTPDYRDHLTRYLERVPDAPDAPLIRRYLSDP